MFDVGMGEVGLIAVVALLVLGPERLPVAARTVGAVLRKARQSWNSVRSEIERELAAEELKRTLKETAAAVDPTQDLKDSMQAVKDDMHATSEEIKASTSIPAIHQPTAGGDERP
jgi:sec-independent protein translocase protein TatB